MIQSLAPYAVQVEHSRGRRYPEPPHPYRNDFQRDRDRVIHSRAFRRLEAKTQLAGEGPQPIDADSEEPRNENLWVRCTKCHNTMLVNLAAMMEEKPKAHANLSAAEGTPYTPTRIFAIGEAIYHKDWDDVGTVIGKEVTASGRNAVIVHFDKSGEKKLLENFKPDED